MAAEGKTPLYFAYDGRLIGMIAVADVVKADSEKAIRQLQDMGICTVMLTGDNYRTARAIGRQAGLSYVIADVLPGDKEQVVRQLMEHGRTAMVGDGINDAPALTRADVGIAIGAGADVALDAADVVLMRSSLMDVASAIRLSRQTLKNIHENLFWAFFYNCIGIPLAAGVLIPAFGLSLNPMFAAAAMSLSSFCVVTNALRLNLFDVHSTRKDKKRTVPETPDFIEALGQKKEKEENKMTKVLHVEGMMCAHCQAHVQKALEGVEGVAKAEVDLEKKTATVTLEKEVADETLAAAVTEAGYQVVNK